MFRILSWLLFMCNIAVLAQCPDASFAVNTSACREENLYVSHNALPDHLYSWDFCSGDHALNPVAEIAVSNSLLFRTRSIRIVNHLGNWYGFTIEQSNSPYRLIRFDFGNNLLNTPAVVDLGNPGGLLNSAFDFQMYYEAGSWYALVANSGGNNIIRYSFGSDITSTPVAQNLGSFGELSTPNGIVLINENNQLTAFVTNGGESKITRLDFGSSIQYTPAATSFNVAGSATLRGIALIKECDRWFGLALSFGNNKVFWLDFNNGLLQPPVTGEITFFTAYNFPASVKLLADGGEYFAYIQSAVGPLYRLSFGSSIIDKTGTGVNLGSFGTSENFACEWIKSGSDWTGFSIDLTNRRLLRYRLPTSCTASLPVYTGQNPPAVYYSSSGSQRIGLEVIDPAGNTKLSVTTVTVSSAAAPDIEISHQNECANHQIHFMNLNNSGNLISYNWQFGDTGSSALPNPSHIYSSAGSYTVNLEVMADNGCTNRTRTNINVFNPPVADFQLPSASPYCTNQAYLFNNTSVFDAGSTISWSWQVNSVNVSENQHLEFTFTSTSPQEIKLIAAIPGCSSEVIKNITTLAEGPVVDFTSAGHCQQDPVNFTNTTSGSVTAFLWDFDDGFTSSEENPVHVFTSPGLFHVRLTATNAAGCANTVARPLTIYSRPQTDFSVALPPFSCSGSPTQFTDLTPNPTDSNLASWLWDFDDAGASSTLRNPQHTYANASTYRVSLTATTNFGCASTITKDVQILPSPVPAFTHSPPCRSVPVQFNDVTPGSIQSRLWQIESSFYTAPNPTHTFNTSGIKSVALTVTATNGCVGTKTLNITVPNVLVPDFMAERTCTNQQTLFTSLTNDAADPITTFNWNFGTAGSASGNPATATFATTGNPSVSLTVITQTGCSYSRTKTVTISAAPVASFTVSADAGGVPLTVHFTNTSTAATSYLWSFGDNAGTTSTAVSPQFTYTELGTFTAELTAFNALACQSRAVRTIHVVVPVLDVRLSLLELLSGTGGITPAVTLLNRSNIPVANPVVDYDLSGMSVVREVLPVTLAPNASYRHVSSIQLPVLNAASYLCATVVLDDGTPADNRYCAGLENTWRVVQPFPNPVSRQEQLTVSWVAASEGNAMIRLYTLSGQEVLSETVLSVQGYNSILLNTSRLQEGLYLVRVQVGGQSFSFRIQVIQ